MRAAGSCWDRGKLEGVCNPCEQLLCYPRLHSFCRNMDAVSPSFLKLPEKLGFCILMQNLPSFQQSPNCGPPSACLRVLCSAEGTRWKTSEAFPAWPLCISPARSPVLRLTCPELQATSVLAQRALSPVCPCLCLCTCALPNPVWKALVPGSLLSETLLAFTAYGRPLVCHCIRGSTASAGVTEMSAVFFTKTVS